MNAPPTTKKSWFARACDHNAVAPWVGVVLFLIPIVLLVGFAIPFDSPDTRPMVRTLLSEGHVVEWTGFFGFFLGGIAGLILTRRLARAGEKKSVVRYYALLSLIFIVMAMEEISWGQRLLGYHVPQFFQNFNEQHETNLHNLPFIQESNEWFLITIGFLGFLVSTFWFHAKRWKFGIPPLIGPWFLLMAVWEMFDVTPLHHLLPADADYAMSYLIEVVETLFGIACLLWVVLNGRILKGGPAAREPAPD